MCRRGARMELRPPEPRPLQLAPPLGHESSLSAYRAWFVEVVLTASGVPELVAESMRVIEECASEAGKFYRRWERLADQSTWPTLGPNRHFALPQVPPYTARRQHGSCTIQPVHSGVPGACGQRPAAGGACCLFVRQSNQASLVTFSCEVCRHRRRDHPIPAPDAAGPEILITKNGSSGINRSLYQAPIGYVSQPRQDKRNQYFVSAEVHQGSLGIGTIFLSCEVLRQYFYQLPCTADRADHPTLYEVLRIPASASPSELRVALKLRDLELRTAGVWRGERVTLERAKSLSGMNQHHAA